MGGYETGSEGPRGHHTPISRGASSAGTASPRRRSCDSPSARTGMAGPRPWRHRGSSTCPTTSVTRASACARGHAHTHVDTWLCVHKHTRIQHVYTTHSHMYHSHAHSTGVHTPTTCSCTQTHMLRHDHTRASTHPTYSHTCVHTCTRTHVCSHVHTHTHTRSRVCTSCTINIHTRTHSHTCVHSAHAHTCVHTCTRTLTHIYTYTCIYLHSTHPHMHTCTHSHMCGPDPPPPTDTDSRTPWAELLRTSGPR